MNLQPYREPGIFSNTLEFEAFVNRVTRSETPNNQGVAFVIARKEGAPVSDDDKKWINEIINESVAKKRYTVVNDLWDFVPERIKNTGLFNWSVGAAKYPQHGRF